MQPFLLPISANGLKRSYKGAKVAPFFIQLNLIFMSRTTNQQPVNKNNKAVTMANKLALAAAKSERSFQTTLERMQLALHLGTFEPLPVMIRADKELQRVLKVQKALKAANLVPVSEYSTLKEIYNDEISELTLDSFTKEAEINAVKFIAKCKGKITDIQEAMVIEFYNKKANVSFDLKRQIENLLILKGVIGGEVKLHTAYVKEQKEAAKIEAETVASEQPTNV